MSCVYSRHKGECSRLDIIISHVPLSAAKLSPSVGCFVQSVLSSERLLLQEQGNVGKVVWVDSDSEAIEAVVSSGDGL